MSTPTPVLLAADARNRGWRTFLQGLAIDVAVAVAAFVLANIDAISDKRALIVAAVALGKTVLTAIASYVMRRYLDTSGVPTPLPPNDPGQPAEPNVGEAGHSTVELALLVVVTILVALIFLGVGLDITNNPGR